MASNDSFMFTVGKIDAGMAILIGERAHLIEFPSILLPHGCVSGSIVNIAVHRNLPEERRQRAEFWDLQDRILTTYGIEVPETPQLELRNVTQTAVTLEWPPLRLATAKLRSLDIYRNGQRLAAIPSPMQNCSTKVSGLQLNEEYTFQLVLKTTAGTFPSNVLKVRTHKITDTSGISVCFGNVVDRVILEQAKEALKEMGAKWSDRIQIDTSHFVCNTPAAAGSGENSSAPGVEYQRALQLSIPVVQPSWILACRNEKRMVPIGNYYLGATPSTSVNSAPFKRPASMSNTQVPMPHPSSPSKNPARASLPPRVNSRSPPSTAFVNQEAPDTPDAREPSPESRARSGPRLAESTEPQSPSVAKGKMNRAFKFPSPTTETPPVSLSHSRSISIPEASPPPIIEKDKEFVTDDGDVGETVEVDLS